MGPAIFGVGCPLAMEREAGSLKLKRAMPAPTGSYLAAKMIMSMGFALLAVGAVITVALVAGQISLTAGELLRHAVVMVVGAVPFAAIGLFIGAHTSGSASAAIANLVSCRCYGWQGCSFRCQRSFSPGS
jgi:ABC-2 type transport system permease protein